MQQLDDSHCQGLRGTFFHMQYSSSSHSIQSLSTADHSSPWRLKEPLCPYLCRATAVCVHAGASIPPCPAVQTLAGVLQLSRPPAGGNTL